MAVVSRTPSLMFLRPEGPMRVGNVSSLMQEAAVWLLDAAIVSNPPHC
ncbi:hypothetical protein OKW30_003529 [Paraburkholderia sp. Clong3]